jgi:hypothetical protein
MVPLCRICGSQEENGTQVRVRRRSVGARVPERGAEVAVRRRDPPVRMAREMSEQSGRPGKYQRTTHGLVVSLVVTVGAIALVLWYMGLFRSETVYEPEQVDYLAGVEGAQDAGLSPAYPAALPEDWIATGVEVVPGGQVEFALKLLTDDEEFVGVRQHEGTVGALLREHVDEETVAVDGYSSPGSVAPEWEGYADDAGDTAYAAELDDTVVLVYGSAPPEDLQTIVDALTREPVA